MLKKAILSLAVIVLLVNTSQAQNKEHLEAINTVWAKFYKAFETLDYALMAEIHSKELVRVSGGKRILDYDTYIKGYESSFQNSKDTNQTSHISLRFFERINTDFTASERGIYKLVRNKGTDKERAYYGQFHVIFKNIDGEWKITLDYDSSEFNTIGEDDFKKAYAIDNLEPFAKD